mgnify:FL=1
MFARSAFSATSSPFTFWRVNESSVLRFLKLIGCDNAKVGNYAALVKERNDTAHSNGNIFFSTQAAMDSRIADILRVVDEIQTHSRPIIDCCYREFLLQNHDPEEREFPDSSDQIREALIHKNYFSRKDIDICCAYDISMHASDINYKSIEELHQNLRATYAD